MSLWTGSIEGCEETRLNTGITPRLGCQPGQMWEQRPRYPPSLGGLNSPERSPKATHPGLGKTSRSRGQGIKAGFLRAWERGGGLGLPGQGNSRAEHRCGQPGEVRDAPGCWQDPHGETHPSSTSPAFFSSAPPAPLFGQGPILTPGREHTQHRHPAHGRGRESRASRQIPTPTPAYNSTRKQPKSPGSAQALAPGRESMHRNPRGCSNWLQTTSPASWFEFSLCLQKKRKILNGLLIFIQHRSEGSSSHIKIHHRRFASLQ